MNSVLMKRAAIDSFTPICIGNFIQGKRMNTGVAVFIHINESLCNKQLIKCNIIFTVAECV